MFDHLISSSLKGQYALLKIGDLSLVVQGAWVTSNLAAAGVTDIKFNVIFKRFNLICNLFEFVVSNEDQEPFITIKLAGWSCDAALLAITTYYLPCLTLPVSLPSATGLGPCCWLPARRPKHTVGYCCQQTYLQQRTQFSKMPRNMHGIIHIPNHLIWL